MINNEPDDSVRTEPSVVLLFFRSLAQVSVYLFALIGIPAFTHHCIVSCRIHVLCVGFLDFSVIKVCLMLGLHMHHFDGPLVVYCYSPSCSEFSCYRYVSICRVTTYNVHCN